MTRIRFENLPSDDTPIKASNLDKLNNVVISPTEPTTGEEVWIDNVNKKIYTKNDNGVYEEFYNEEDDTGWVNLPYMNSYESYDEANYNPLQYRKIGKQVFFRGLLKCSLANQIGWYSSCTTLPNEIIPKYNAYFIIRQGSDTTPCVEASVTSSGTLQIHNTEANVYLALDGVVYFVD